MFFTISEIPFEDALRDIPPVADDFDRIVFFGNEGSGRVSLSAVGFQDKTDPPGQIAVISHLSKVPCLQVYDT